ncbi:variant [Rhypophila sp. PSN 637]
MSESTLFINARIFRSDAKPGTSPGLHGLPSFAQCMLIRGSQIEHVGSESDEPIKAALSSASPPAIVDLKGKTVLPGFVDGHMHLMLLGQALNKLDIGHCKSLSDIRTAISAYAVANPDVPRILCRGYMHSMTDPHKVTSADLDGLDTPSLAAGRPERPILIDTKDLHSSWCNSSAVKDLEADTWADVPGGTIERDPSTGALTGVFTEAANITYVWPYLARVASMSERIDSIRAAVANYHQFGYTGLIDMAMDEGAWEALQSVRRETSNPLPMRIAAYWLIRPGKSDQEHLAQVDRAIELSKQYNATTSPDCRIVGIKIICDGIIDACTAGLSEPYLSSNSHTSPDEPMTAGIPLWTAEQLIPVVKAATAANLQIALHAIGDGTIKTVIDVLSAYANPSSRPRVEHLELSSAQDAIRLGKAGITASIQPVHADPAILGAWPRLLGKHRCGRAFAYREFADHGAPLALGSDSPTAPHCPLGNIYVAATRRSFREKGMDVSVTVDDKEDSHVVRNEKFRLGVCEAFAAATEGAAYSCFDEERVGRLEKGLKADFVIVGGLGGDDWDWDWKGDGKEGDGEVERLASTAKVEETWFDGVRVWSV